MTRHIYILLIIVLPLASCSQRSNGTLADFRTEIYDTCHIEFENQVPRKFWYSMDKNLNLNKSIDSVLWVRINGTIDDRTDIPVNEKSRAIRIEDLHKCSELGFFEFNSSSNGHWSDLLDFKKFPQLRYVHSDHLMTEDQLNDLLCTAKNLKGLQIKINFEVPECICELEHLRYLVITNAGEVSLPKCIKDIPNLKYLALNGNGIGADDLLNQTIWNIPSLELLRIDGGKYVDIKPSVSNMHRLKQLDIVSVDSISYPVEFTQLDSLELLNISWVNKKMKFPNSLSQMNRLKAIKLVQVRLTELPLMQNHSVVEYIYYHEIHELDELQNLNFHDLDKLKHLWLSGSAFQVLDSIPNGIQSLPVLESIELLGFGFSHDNEFRRRINNYTYPNEFGGGFDKTFDYYKWLFIIGKPAKLHPKMYN